MHQRGRARVGKGKKGGKGRDGAGGREEKREGGEGEERERKGDTRHTNPSLLPAPLVVPRH